MNKMSLHEEAWPYVTTLFPPDISETARSSGALVRCRNIPNAETLLRLALAYAVSDLSFKDVAAWAHGMKVAEITGPGVFYRLREAERWLQGVLAGVLQPQVISAQVNLGRRLRIVDASVITGPGSEGTDWRVHVNVDPITGGLSSVELTDAHGGESYSRWKPSPGEILLGDRCYSRARGIAAVHEAGAHVVVRVTPEAIRLCTPDRHVLRVAALEAEVPQIGPHEWPVLIPVPPDGRHYWSLSKAKDWIPARLVAARTKDDKCIWLLTTLAKEEITDAQVLCLYRLRWQVELAFKRLKSLLHIDTLPSRHGPTARSWLLSRLLAAALAQRLAQPNGPFSPWGYEINEARLHSQRMVPIPHGPLGPSLRHPGRRPLAAGDQRKAHGQATELPEKKETSY
jgi:hypothetical protein